MSSAQTEQTPTVHVHTAPKAFAVGRDSAACLSAGQNVRPTCSAELELVVLVAALIAPPVDVVRGPNFVRILLVEVAPPN